MSTKDMDALKSRQLIRSLPDSCGAVEKNKGIHVNSVKDI